MSANLATLQDMIVIVFKYLTPKGFRGITLFPFVIFTHAADRLDKVVVNHERIHIRQQLELLVLPFYVWYFVEFLFRLLQYKSRSKAYRNISFEREAYENEKDLEYVSKRGFWRFLRYV